MIFRNRYEAAVLLARKLSKYKNMDGIVLGVPRGGVPIGFEVAKSLNFPLEVILSKKIGHPYNPEFAIGAVSLGGVLIDQSIQDVSKEYIDHEVPRLLKILQDKYRLFMGNRKPANLKNKIVIVTDDGIATGNTLLGIIDLIKKSEARKIIIGAPVASVSAFEQISLEVDEIVCLDVPEYFRGVGQFYADFTPTSDEEVIQLLNEAKDLRSGTQGNSF